MVIRSSLIALGAIVFFLNAAAARAEESDAPAALPPNVTLPTLVEHVDPIYPPEKLAQALDKKVELLVTVEREGTVGDIVVLQSGGIDFDNAAREAVKRWRFIPATRGGVAIRSRIHVPFHFAVSVHAPAEPDHAILEPVLQALQRKHRPHAPPKPKIVEYQETPVDLGTPLGLPHTLHDHGKIVESHVQGRIQPANRSESDILLERDLIQSVPRFSASDIIRSAPGMLVTRPYGEAIAPRFSLRGFDADHGRDIRFTILGTIPLNQPSHVHGHGYADIDTLIPETVRYVRVLEGAYDPNQGEFAVAGSVDFDLGVEDRGIRSSYGYGSFGTLTALGVLAPVGHAEETFGAASVRTSDGFGNGSRAGTSGAFIGQYRLEMPANTTAILHVSGHGVQSGVGGVLRREDIYSGRVGFHDTYDDASARAQVAAVARVQGGFSLHKAGNDGTSTSIGLWGAYATYRSRINMTGYVERSQLQPRIVGRGDLVEQVNDDIGFGARLSLQTRRFRLLSWLDAQFTRGADIEIHVIDQAQSLITAPKNLVWDSRINADIRTFRSGLFLDGVVSITERARVRGGLRTDVVLFQVQDRLEHGSALSQNDNFPDPGTRRTIAGVGWGPRVALEIDPRPNLRLSAAYGQGYRSPNALQLVENEEIPFAKVHSYEIGARLKLDPRRVSAAFIAYETRLSDDWAFGATPGRYVRIGSTVRRGLVTYIQAEPVKGLKTSFSATYVHATVDAPPAAIPGSANSGFIEGQSIPYVPPVLIRTDVRYERPLLAIGSKPLIGRIGYGATFISSRPLPYGLEAKPAFSLDASASIRRDPVEIGIDAVNLFDRPYADTEYVFVSDWKTGDIPSQLPAKHLSPGAPRTVLATASFRF